MTTSRIWLTLPLVAAVAVWAGCQGKTSSDGSGAPRVDQHGEHGHDHDHEHHHHGPHGGHVMVIGNEEYHAEWTHEDGTITFYILDAAAKNEVPIAAESLQVEVKIGDNEPTTYELVAVDPQGEEMKTAQFRTVDKELEGVLSTLSPNVTATLHVTIEGKHYHAKIEEHSHDH